MLLHLNPNVYASNMLKCRICFLGFASDFRNPGFVFWDITISINKTSHINWWLKFPKCWRNPGMCCWNPIYLPMLIYFPFQSQVDVWTSCFNRWNPASIAAEIPSFAAEKSASRLEKEILRRRLLMERAAERAEMRQLLDQNALMMVCIYIYTYM